MKERITIDLSDIEQSAKIAHALSSQIRLQILYLIKEMPLNISEIASQLNIPISTCALQINVLEEAGIVITTHKPGLRGSQKVCGLRLSSILFNFIDNATSTAENIVVESMPIGNYFDFEVAPPCGIVTDSGQIGSEDSIFGFYQPEHADAQLIWFTTGYLEYRFATERIRKLKKIKKYSFSFELCSEAPGYQNDWKSDITIKINHHTLCTLYSPGDYGDRRGQLNPEWWDHNNTQYGRLYEIEITEDGIFVDGAFVTEDHTIHTLHLTDSPFIRFEIGVEKDSRYVGGINLFGEHFGDYSQNIIMKVYY